jgi:hypothetical protein
MDLLYLSKLITLIIYLNKNIAKIRDMFKGGKKLCQTAAVYMQILSFIVLSIWLNIKMICFESFDIW